MSDTDYFDDGGYDPLDVTMGDYFYELFGPIERDSVGSCHICGQVGCLWNPEWGPGGTDECETGCLNELRMKGMRFGR